MRLIFGIIIGCLLTVGGAYVIDTVSPAEAKMVNWDKSSPTEPPVIRVTTRLKV